MKQLVPSRGERITRGVGHFGVLLPLFIRCVAWCRCDGQRPTIGSDLKMFTQHGTPQGWEKIT